MCKGLKSTIGPSLDGIINYLIDLKEKNIVAYIVEERVEPRFNATDLTIKIRLFNIKIGENNNE